MNRRLPTQWVPGLVALLLLALWPAISARATNLALGKPAFASWNSPVAGTGTDTTANLTDGNFTTSWNNAGSPNTGNDQAGVDLGAISSFRYVRLNWTGDHATAFTVEVGDAVDTDPTSFFYGTGDWSIVYTRTADPAGFSTANDFIDIGAQSHRYVRIAGTVSSNTSTVWGINELQVLDVAPAITGTALFGTNPVNNAFIEIIGPQPVTNGPPSSVSKAKTDATGAFNFTGLYDGTYVLFAIAPGQYAPVQSTAAVSGGGVVTQNLTFTQVVQNTAANTAPLPNYNLDNISNPGESNGGNASSGGLNLPSDELPAGDSLWFTGAANGGFPAGTTFGLGSLMPPTLNFWFPPTAPGKNNVITSVNAVIPVPPAKYSALYMIQNGTDGQGDTLAYLNYTDGTVQPVVSVAGNSLYRFNNGGGGAGDDEIVAFSVDKRLKSTDGTAVPEGNTPPAFNVFMRFIIADSTKVLKSISFGPDLLNANTTLSAFIFAWSGDTIDVPGPVGSISGTVKKPVSEGSGPVANAFVKMLSYTINTSADGTYMFRGLPTGTYSISANKPANYPVTTISVPVAAPDAVTGADIQFPYPIPVITDPLTNPTLDQISTDDPAATTTDPAKFGDFQFTAFGLGSEYMPKGLYSPNTVADPLPDTVHHNGASIKNWEASAGAPGALAFDFGDPTIDSPVAPGVAGYPEGGTPNLISIRDYELLAPQTNVLNCYLAVTGLEGGVNMRATLNYADGTSEVKPIAISDWYQPGTSNELPYVTMHGRHTTAGGRTPPWEDGVGSTTSSAANIYIKALVIPCNPAKVLHDIRFDRSNQTNKYPFVSAVSWETATPQPVSSDIRVTVKMSDGVTPAAGAWIAMSPYSTKCDANGVGVFKGVPAGQKVDLDAFLYGQTKPGVLAGHVVPVGMKMPAPDDVTITLPAEAPVFTYLPLNYNFDMIAMADMTGDYKGSSGGDTCFNGDLMPASGTIVQDARTNNVPFKMPNKETYFNNVQRCNGQTWQIAPGHYSALSIIGEGQGNGNFGTLAYYEHFTLTYDDGTSEQVQIAHHDWVGNWTNPGTQTPKRMFYREFSPAAAPNLTDVGFNIRSRRENNSDESRNADSTAAFVQQLLPVNAAKVLKSVTLPYMFSGVGTNDFSILAATLEGSDVVSTTVTGTVVGQPLGASSSGPLNMAQVIFDDAHMAYTAADGTFSISSVAPGTYSVTVIPVATGILTKTFPATIAAGANSLGTLDVGAGQTYIYAVLGATNISNGLKQMEGVFNGYSSDTNRPRNLVNVTDSMTSPVAVGGRQNRIDNISQANDYFYFQVDPGWLYRGRMGDIGKMPSEDGTVPGVPATGPGMDLNTFVMPASPPAGGGGLPGTANWKVGPHVRIRIEYFDNAKAGQTNDSIGLNYNRMEGWTHSMSGTPWVSTAGATATLGSNRTMRTTDPYRTIQTKNAAGTGNTDWIVTKGSTNTWKTFEWDLVPVASANTYMAPGTAVMEAFGAYKNQNLFADFRLNPRSNTGDNPDIIRSVIIYLDGTSVPTLPAVPSASDALKIAAGLQAATSGTMGVDDIAAPSGVITIQDAIALAKQGLK
ncbi:MAG TPA: carboxypeptidase-like regulatory domain-containing protein [Armatimonadota bacterium]|jgi:hypothetical protein